MQLKNIVRQKEKENSKSVMVQVLYQYLNYFEAKTFTAIIRHYISQETPQEENSVTLKRIISQLSFVSEDDNNDNLTNSLTRTTTLSRNSMKQMKENKVRCIRKAAKALQAAIYYSKYIDPKVYSDTLDVYKEYIKLLGKTPSRGKKLN